MKNMLLAGLALMIFTGCTTTKGFKSDETKLYLDGNPTTGFSWILHIEDSSIVEIEESSEYLGADGVVGAPSKFCYTIHSIKPGSTVLRFEYRRPWEKNPPLEVQIYDINVEADGTLLVKERTAD